VAVTPLAALSGELAAVTTTYGPQVQQVRQAIAAEHFDGAIELGDDLHTVTV
jgi:hypothetical protein